MYFCDEVTVFRGKEPILRQVSFSLPSRGFVLIQGENGSGKTTLLDVLSGIHQHYSGTVLLEGQSIRSLSVSNIANRGVARLFQRPRIFDFLTVDENVLLANQPSLNLLAHAVRFIRSKNEVRHEIIDEMGLGHKRGHRGSGLSFGEAKMLALCLAIVRQHTQVLLLDEPFAGVDDRTCEQISHLIRHQCSEKLIVVVDHTQALHTLSALNNSLVLTCDSSCQRLFVSLSE